MKRFGWVGLVGAAAVIGGLPAVPVAAAPVGPDRPLPVVAARAPIGPVTIGRVAPTGVTACIGGYVWYQAFEDPNQTQYRVPYDGVVTAVSHYANANAARIQAVFLRATGTDFVYSISHKTGSLTLSPSVLNTFPVRVPVQAGELLALRTVDDGAVRCIAPGGTIDQITAGAVGDAAGTFGPPTLSNLHQFVNISAVVEPDVDGDGYGDASQDRCPQLAAVHDPCPAPSVMVTKSPKKRITTHKVKVKFSSTIAGSTYRCSIDGRAFKPCRSPFKGRFPFGTHTVRVQATSAVGLPGEAVTVQFKVVKPKR